MILGSGFLVLGGGGGVRRIAERTAPSSNADATGPSEANHTSSSDSSRARMARATSAAMRCAFSAAFRDMGPVGESSSLGWSALTGLAKVQLVDGNKGAKATNKPLELPIKNFYLTDVISRR